MTNIDPRRLAAPEENILGTFLDRCQWQSAAAWMAEGGIEGADSYEILMFPALLPSRFPMPAGPSLGHSGGDAMLDVIMLAIGAGAFVLFIGYVALCERL
jgi:hypothetical protein